MPTPAPPLPSGLRLLDHGSQPESWLSAIASRPRPSASGVSAVRRTARTTRAARTSCPGRPRTKSGPLCARCGGPPAFPWMTSPVLAPPSCPTRTLTRATASLNPRAWAARAPRDRGAVSRILNAGGVGRLPRAARARRSHSRFKAYDLGFVHVDVKHLPKLRDRNGESRKRYLYVAIDRASRFVHLAVKDDETERSAVAFLQEALMAFPFQVTHVLTDRGSCFTADGFERACQSLGVEHRKTRPYTPRTNGMVERFNGRIQREVLGITVASHRDLETLLHGFNQAYNARRQRVLKGRSPDMVVRERLSATPDRANRSHDPPFDPCSLPKALQVIARAKDVSHPDN